MLKEKRLTRSESSLIILNWTVVGDYFESSTKGTMGRRQKGLTVIGQVALFFDVLLWQFIYLPKPFPRFSVWSRSSFCPAPTNIPANRLLLISRFWRDNILRDFIFAFSLRKKTNNFRDSCVLTWFYFFKKSLNALKFLDKLGNANEDLGRLYFTCEITQIVNLQLTLFHHRELNFPLNGPNHWNQSIICVFVVICQHMLLFLHMIIIFFLWFEFSVCVLNFACSNQPAKRFL